MSKSYKPLYQESQKLLAQKEAENVTLREQNSALQQKFDTQVAENQTTKTTLEAKISESETQKQQLETEKEALEEKNADLSEKLQEKELSRFASAYATQEKEYKEQQEKWFKLSLWATCFLVVSVLISIFGPHVLEDAQWYKEPGFYLLNVVFITLFVYTLKQHSHFGNLRIDYANRKTLAQSYQYIIADEDETSAIRTRFLERSADVFSSKATPHSNDVTVYEAVAAKLTGKE